MKTVEKRIERLEAIYGGPLLPFPKLTDLAEEEVKKAIKAWFTCVINRSYGETPDELLNRLITELAPEEKIALAEYFETMEERGRND